MSSEIQMNGKNVCRMLLVMVLLFVGLICLAEYWQLGVGLLCFKSIPYLFEACDRK